MKSIIALLVLMQGLSAMAQEASAPRVQQSLEHGTDAREKHDFSGAEKEYLSALSASSKETTYRSLFYLGLNKQEEANAAAAKGDAAAATALLDAAADYYRQALDVRPTSTGTILNLALIDLERGKKEEGTTLLERGLELAKAAKSPSAAKFAERLGDLQDNPVNAIDYYRMAAASGKPSDALGTKIRKALFLIAAANPEKQTDVIDYGWTLYQAGDVEGALDTALTAMESDPPFSPANAGEMLTLATAALARKNYDGVTFAGSDAVHRLIAMRKIPNVLIPRVQTLLALYQGDVKEAAALAVWRSDWDSSRPYDRPTSMQAVQQVARGLGYAAQLRKDFAAAERYYRLAIDADRVHPDAATLRDLATLYYAQQRLPELEQLLKQFETSLYESKGGAYDRVEWENVAEYHRTLGMMYSWLHRDRDAKLQFEREFEAVKQENAKRQEANRTDLLQIDPTVRLQYADTLAALNDREHATAERLAVAESCSAGGKIACVRDAVAHIDRADLKSPADVASFDGYLDAAVKLQASGAPIANIGALKSQLAIYSSDPSPLARKQAEDALRTRYGVTGLALANNQGTLQLGDQVLKFELPVE